MPTKWLLACWWDKGGEKCYWIFDFLLKNFAFPVVCSKQTLLQKSHWITQITIKRDFKIKFYNRLMYILYMMYSFVASNYLTISYNLPFFPFCIFVPSFIGPHCLTCIYSSLFLLFMHSFSMAASFFTSQIFSSLVDFCVWSCSETCVNSINLHLKKAASPSLALKSNGLMGKRCMTSAFYLFLGSLWIRSHVMHLGMLALLEDSWTVTVAVWCFQTNTYIAGV